MSHKQISANITRRDALKIGAAAAVGTVAACLGAAKAEQALPSSPVLPDSKWSQLRGFNYQPSYGTNGFELWQKFDAATIEAELGRGKRYFPRHSTSSLNSRKGFQP